MDGWMNMLSYITILITYGVFTIGVYLLLICIVVGVHEFGHYQMARFCNIKVLEFSLGFGKILYQKELTKDKTLFTFRALPLGGFVKPLDKASLKEEEWEALPESEKARAYNKVNRGKKVLMIAGGPLINFILGFLLYLGAMMFVGSPKYEPIIASVSPNTVLAQSGIQEGEKIETINGKPMKYSNDAIKELISLAIQGQKINIVTDVGVYNVNYEGQDFSKYGRSIDKGIGIYFVGPEGDYYVNQIMPGSVGEQAGIQLEDQIISVDDHKIVSSAWLVNKFSSNPEKPIELKLKRQGKEFTTVVVPNKVTDEFGNEKGLVGIGFTIANMIQAENKKESFLSAVPKSINNVQQDIANTVFAISKLLSAELSPKSLSGPVAILEFSGKAAFNGLYSYINLMALISVGIGFFNLLPLPMLDGGQIVVHTIEAIRRKDFTDKFQRNLQFLGIMMLLSFLVFVMVQDLRNLF